MAHNVQKIAAPNCDLFPDELALAMVVAAKLQANMMEAMRTAAALRLARERPIIEAMRAADAVRIAREKPMIDAMHAASTARLASQTVYFDTLRASLRSNIARPLKDVLVEVNAKSKGAPREDPAAAPPISSTSIASARSPLAVRRRHAPLDGVVALQRRMADLDVTMPGSLRAARKSRGSAP